MGLPSLNRSKGGGISFRKESCPPGNGSAKQAHCRPGRGRATGKPEIGPGGFRCFVTESLCGSVCVLRVTVLVCRALSCPRQERDAHVARGVRWLS